MSEALEYAKFLDQMGSQIIDISKSLKSEEEIKKCKDVDDLAECRKGIRDGLNQYIEVRNKMAAANRPAAIELEHHELVDSFDDFLRGTQMLLDSIDIINGRTNTENLHLGFAKQEISQARTKDVVERIAQKLAELAP